MKDIVTVIIKDDNDEYSTVSFLNMRDAINYCLDKICPSDEAFPPGEVESIRSALEEQHMFEDVDGNDTYYIEEARLCETYESEQN